MSLRRAAALALAALSVAACDARSEAPSFQGYVEADPVFVAPEEAGRLVALAVEEGERVAEGGAVFALDTELEGAELAEARAQLAEARATLADLRARQQRPEEIAVLKARKRRAETALALSARELERPENQLQAVQMSFFFFLPNLLLSGFMFPFRGMPEWAQWLGELLPLTHFVRIVRGIMLKGSGVDELVRDVAGLMIFMALAMLIALARFRRTLD